MTVTAHSIDRLVVQWGAVPDEHRRRIQQLQEALVDVALEDVLDGIGVASHEEVCVRDVVVPPYACRWSDTDAQLLDGWSRAIAAAIAAAVGASNATGTSSDGSGGAGGSWMGSSSGAHVVRYPSVEHAALDLVVGTLTGDTERAWAWAQLGLLPADVAPGAVAGADHVLVVLRTLRDRPHLVVPAIVRLAARGAVSALVRALGSDAFVDAVDAAWVASGGSPHRWLTGAVDSDAVLRGASVATAVTRSTIWRAVTADGRAITTGESALAFAALALLEVEPALARSPQAASIVRAVVATERAEPAAAAAAAAAATTEPAPDHVSATDPDPEPARTAWGGLLFLVHLVGSTGVVDRFLERTDASGRALLWALGRALVDRAITDDDPPVPDDDPALLAFCGVPPFCPVERGAERHVPRDKTVEVEVEVEVEVVLAALHGLIEPAGDEDPLRMVCHRDAVVEAEPGWIDVVFALDEASIDVRRAGLDLDPGYVPALGCVLRFRYA